MFTSSWFPWRLGRRHKGRPPQSPKVRRNSTRLAVEQLEDRTVPSTFLVSSFKDAGRGTLRQAVLDANAHVGADVIEFAPKLKGTIGLISPEMAISDAVTIRGPGADRLTISVVLDPRKNPNPSRVFSILGGVTAEISGLTIANGRGQGYGGAIANSGMLTLTDCTLSGNAARDIGYAGHGGAISNTGTLTVSGCTLTGNFAQGHYGQGVPGIGGWGGGIANNGTLTISNSTLSSNVAHDGASTEWWPGSVGYGSGGGIRNSGTMTVNGCTIIGNDASYGGGVYNNGTMIVSSSTLRENNVYYSSLSGGGIYNASAGTATVSGSTVAANRNGILNSGTMTLVNSTVSGNESGGISHQSGALLTVVNCTMTANTTSTVGASGGINIYGGSVYVRNTIVAGNIAGASNSPDLSGALTSSGYNLIGNSSGGSGYDPTDLLDLDPHLGPLQDNGGPTWTHALLAGSPALDAGNSALLPADTLDLDGDGDTTEPIPFDQRGSGSFRVVNGKLDVGAFEVQAAARSTVTTSPGALGATLAAVGPPVPVAAAPVRGVATGVEVFVPSNSPGGLGDAWLGALDRLFAEDLLFGNKLRRHDP